MVLLQITRALTGGSDRAEILYQVNGPITREFRPLDRSRDSGPSRCAKTALQGWGDF